MDNVERLKALGIDLKGHPTGQTKTKCPKCSHQRKAANRKEPCLSVNVDEGIYKCHNCGWEGGVVENKYELPNWKPTEVKEDHKLIKWLNSERKISHSTMAHFKVGISKQFIPKDQGEVDVVEFPYMRNDTCVNVKYRSGSKGFKMVQNAELIMFGMNELSKSEGPVESVVITEGEIDAMSVWQAGRWLVLSVPNGASSGSNNLKYIDNSAVHLEKVSKFYLAMDKDEPGEGLTAEIARRMGKDKCYIVDYPAGCKDANQVLVEHGEDVLAQCLKDARPLPIEGVVETKDCFDDLVKLYKDGIAKGDMLGVNGFDDLVSFKTSMLYIITGIPTHGKSSFLNWMECLLAARCGWKGAIFSPEHYPLEYMIYKYSEILMGKSFFRSHDDRMNQDEMKVSVDFMQDNFYFIRPTDGMYTMKELLKIAKSLVLRHGIKFLTIDPWNTIKHDYTSGMTETQYIETALNELTIFKQVHDIAIFLVAHPKKMPKVKDQGDGLYGMYEVPTLYDISGSKSFYDKADVGITVYRNFETGLTTAYVQKVKFKHLGNIGMQTFQYKVNTSRYVAAGDDLQPLNSEDRGHHYLIHVGPHQRELSNDWFDSTKQQEEQFENQSINHEPESEPDIFDDQDEIPF